MKNRLMWECPKCHRKFKHTHQEHSCKVYDMSHHLEGKPEPIIQIVESLVENARSLGSDIKVVPLKGSILCSTRETFLAIKPAKAWVQIEFTSLTAEEDFPVFKVLQASKHKFYHFVRLDSPEDFNDQIKTWISSACNISRL